MSRNILPEPPEELKRLSHELCGRIRERLGADGKMPFSRFMEMALYEPGLGYYSAGLHKLGAEGDFVTAPETGPLFAGCLARQVKELAGVLGEYVIVEAGPGTGRLAADLLRQLPEQFLPERYLMLERSADLRRVQRQNIAQAVPSLTDRVDWLDEPPREGWAGVLIANEVLDALAVERFRVSEDGLQQVCVATRGEGFDWAFRAAPPQLENAVEHVIADLGSRLPPSYRSEINPHMAAWLEALTGEMQRGLAVFIDYGFPRGEYYRPDRSDGTLMCHYRHRAHDDVFFWPGLQDLTAWVDFTALAEAADACDLDVLGYASQAMFLVACGLDQVFARHGAGSDDGGLVLGAQARQLTHPGLMGQKFQVMGLGRGLDTPLSGFSLEDLRYRL